MESQEDDDRRLMEVRESTEDCDDRSDHMEPAEPAEPAVDCEEDREEALGICQGVGLGGDEWLMEPHILRVCTLRINRGVKEACG